MAQNAASNKLDKRKTSEWIIIIIITMREKSDTRENKGLLTQIKRIKLSKSLEKKKRQHRSGYKYKASCFLDEEKQLGRHPTRDWWKHMDRARRNAMERKANGW